ncbi:hypothetical protein KY361_04470 [Candidatus Woesearchaeota archaeon]|nr:hypothetical protein [Candidatus Woesearchaeota archaeon]
MKRLLFLILIMLSVPAYSVTKENINLELWESIVVGGRNFTLVGISAYKDTVMMTIDDEKHAVSTNRTESINGIHISVGWVYKTTRWRNGFAELNISMNYTCGNGKCESRWENHENCCIDCNCSGNYTCYNKKCVKSEFIQCYRNAECRDEYPCTEDYCSGFPKLCYHREITECRHGDGCCPSNCTAVEDEDCYVEKLKCKTDADCDDNNVSTIDKCSKITNWCSHVLNETKGEVEEENITNITVETPKPAVEKKSFLKKLLDWLKGLF